MRISLPELAAVLIYKVPTEYKVHPDDWNELRTQLKPHMVHYANNDPLRGPEVFGLRIVLDYSAERLPTKVPNACGEPGHD